jgi:Flp pilus assembly protein TadD
MAKRRRKKRSPAAPPPSPRPAPPPAPADARGRVPRGLVAALVFVCAFLLFVPTWKNPFVLDDILKIESNPDMRLPFRLHNFVYPYSDNTTGLRNEPSRPLTYMVYWLCWHIGSGTPPPFHVANAILHGAAAALAALLAIEVLLLLFGERAPLAGALAGLLFAASPLVAGTAAYVYGLSDVLSAALCLAALLLVVRSGAPGRGTVALACSLLVLALASKEIAIVLPALAAAADLCAGGWARVRSRVRVYVPLLLVVAAYLAARWVFLGGVGDLEGRGALQPVGLYASMQGGMILTYLKLLVVPAGLTIDHLPVAGDYPGWLRLLAWGAVAGLTLAALREGFRPPGKAVRRLLALGWLLFLFCLLPTSSVFPTVDLLVERRAYFAAVGIFLILAGLLWRLGRGPRRPARAAAVAAAVVLVLGQTGLTLQRNRVYGSTESLWREALERNPLNRRALSNLGTSYSRVERWDEAIEVFERILEHNPDDGAIYSKLGYIFMQPGYPGHSDDKALDYLRKGLELNPTNVFGLYNAAVLNRRMNRPGPAEDLLQRAIRLNPNFAVAYGLLGEIALEQNRRDEAIGRFREALRLDPNDAAAAARLRELTGR